MKRYLIASLAGVFGLCLGSPVLAYSGSYSPGTGINGTVHDLGTAHNGLPYVASPADSLQRICIFCHAPHNAYKLSPANGGPAAGIGGGPVAPDAFDYLPLWNHELTPNYDAFKMYDNGVGAPKVGAKASQAILNGMSPGGVSLLCLSCHDGSIAVNSYGNSAQLSMSGSGPVISPVYQIGKDSYLGNHHPIGFSYDDVQLGDPEIRNPDTALLTGSTSIRDHLFGAGSSMMECATCHSVHNKGNTGERLLWRSDQNSELCLTCHDKGIYTAP